MSETRDDYMRLPGGSWHHINDIPTGDELDLDDTTDEGVDCE